MAVGARSLEELHSRGRTPAHHDLAERVALLADRAGADAAASLIRHALRRGDSRLPRICFVGGTNVGKSRLINELAGEPCLPVSVHSTGGPPVAVRAAGRGPGDGGADTVFADVPEDSWLASSEAELVDTPSWDLWSGVGRPDTAALARAVAACDVVVVVTEARHALPATEQARIGVLAAAPHTPPLVVVVTKLAEVADEADDVLRRVRRIVSGLAPSAQAVAGPVPGAPPDGPGGIDHVRRAVLQPAGSRLRRTLRTVRMLDLLADTCDTIAQASRRALDEQPEEDDLRARTSLIWRTAHESAAVHWIVLAAEISQWCDAVTADIGREASRRRASQARELATQLSDFLESPAEQHFIRLHAVPRTAEALQSFTDWIIALVDRRLAEDTARLRDILRRNRPGTDLLRGLATPRAEQVVPTATLPGSAAAAAAAESDNATAWDASWLPDLIGTTIEGVLTPLSADIVGKAVGALGTALVTEALEHGQAERREQLIDDLESVVTTAFSEQVQRTLAGVRQVYARLRTHAREQDEEWWRLHTTALTSLPDSVGHWRALHRSAATLGQQVRTELARLEGT